MPVSTSDENVIPFIRKGLASRVVPFESYEPGNVANFFKTVGSDTALTRNALEMWDSLMAVMCHPVTICYLTYPEEVSSISNVDMFICLIGPNNNIDDIILNEYPVADFPKSVDSKLEPVINKIVSNYNITSVSQRQNYITGNYFQLSIGNLGWNLRLVSK